LYTLHKWDEAQAIYKTLVQEQPDNVHLAGYLGLIAARKGEREVALNISGKLAKLKTPYLFGQHTFIRACIHALLGEKKEAMKLLRTSISEGISYLYLHADMNLEPLLENQQFQTLIRPKE